MNTLARSNQPIIILGHESVPDLVFTSAEARYIAQLL